MIPIGILLDRWFDDKKSTAIGICSASTGLSTLGIPTLISRSVESYGLKATFLAEAFIMALIVLISFLLIRSSPEEKNTSKYGEKKEAPASAVLPTQAIDRRSLALLYPSVFLVGCVMSVAYLHISMLITGEGYPTESAALAATVSGFAMIAGKLILGRMSDRFGCYKSNFFFGFALVSGLVMLAFISVSPFLIYLASAVYSGGFAFTSLGLTLWATDLTGGDSEKYIRRFQTVYALGTFVLSPLPGVIADRMGGSYRASYILFAILALYIVFAVQLCYRKKEKSFNYQ